MSDKIKSVILFVAIETCLFLAPAIEKKPMTAKEAEAIMDRWFMSYYGHPSKVHVGGVDKKQKDDKEPWGDKGLFYVGYYDDRDYGVVGMEGAYFVVGTGFSWFGKGETIEDAMYDCLKEGHGPMKFVGNFPTGNPEYKWDYEEEAKFIKSIGRKPIRRGAP